jgi:hypothetical protein
MLALCDDDTDGVPIEYAFGLFVGVSEPHTVAFSNAVSNGHIHAEFVRNSVDYADEVGNCECYLFSDAVFVFLINADALTVGDFYIFRDTLSHLDFNSFSYELSYCHKYAVTDFHDLDDFDIDVYGD